MLVSIFISIIFSYVNVRTKLGITPLLIVFSSYGIVKTFEVIKTGNLRILSVPIIIILLFILTNSFIIKKPEFSNYDAYYHFGEIAENEERYEEAIYNYNRSLMLNDRYETLLSLGNTFAKKQDFTNSLSAYNEAEKRNADDYYLHFNKGIVFANNGNYEKALESYTKSLNLNPDYPLTYRNIGILFYVSENYTEALKYFNKFLSLSDDQETNALVKKDIENIKMKLKN
jgi:tetratricopeptide (TPR) repeat protein